MDTRKTIMFGATALAVLALLFVPSWREKGEISAGATIYKNQCESCHGVQGLGATGNRVATLNNEGFLKIADDKYIFDSIRQGRPTAGMPAITGTTVSDEEAKKLIKYMRSWRPDIHPIAQTAEKANGNAKRGEIFYSGSCSICHGEYGEGGSGASLIDPGFLKSASDSFLLNSMKLGRPGTNMLAYPDSQSLKDVVAFLRTKENAPAPKNPVALSEQKPLGQPLAEQKANEQKSAEQKPAANNPALAKGKELATGKGTCTACHIIGKDGSTTIGPDLSKIGAKFDAAKLVKIMTNPAGEGLKATMPPAAALSDDEKKDVAEYLASLK